MIHIIAQSIVAEKTRTIITDKPMLLFNIRSSDVKLIFDVIFQLILINKIIEHAMLDEEAMTVNMDKVDETIDRVLHYLAALGDS